RGEALGEEELGAGREIMDDLEQRRALVAAARAAARIGGDGDRGQVASRLRVGGMIDAGRDHADDRPAPVLAEAAGPPRARGRAPPRSSMPSGAAARAIPAARSASAIAAVPLLTRRRPLPWPPRSPPTRGRARGAPLPYPAPGRVPGGAPGRSRRTGPGSPPA